MLLAGTLAGLVLALVLIPAAPVAAATCAGNYVNRYEIIYTSGPPSWKQVGECTQSCTGPETCTGERTAYSYMLVIGCCPVV